MPPRRPADHYECFQTAPKKDRQICRKMGQVPKNLSASTPKQVAISKRQT